MAILHSLSLVLILRDVSWTWKIFDLATLNIRLDFQKHKWFDGFVHSAMDVFRRLEKEMSNYEFAKF